MKRFLCILALVSLLLSAAAPASARELMWNEVNGEDYGATVGARVFAEKLAELSGGTLTIDLYTNAALGSEGESMQGLQMGTLDIFRGNASSLGDWGAELIGATGLPYLFQSTEDFQEMAEGPLGQELLDSVEASGCGYIALAWLVEPPRNLFITRDAYARLGEPGEITLDMMQGLDIRVPGTQMLNDTVQALGANPIQVDYAQMVQALQSGIIDGAENGVITYASQGFCEAAPYFIEDAHIFGCGVVLVSSAAWDSLTDQQKAWMKEAGAAASEACFRHNLMQEKESYARFAEKGAKLLPVADLEAWQDACRDIYAHQSAAVQAVIQRIQEHDF